MPRENADRVLFNHIAERYAAKDLVASSSVARKSQLLSALRPLLDEAVSLGTLVEIGCGVGAPAKYLDGHYQRYLGIDQSEQMVKAAGVFNQGNLRAEFMTANVKSRDLPCQVADVILSVGALHHMTQLDDVLRSLSRIAKRGAFLVVIEPQNGNPLVQAARYVRRILDPTYSRDQVFFRERELANLLPEHGIEVLSVAFQGFLTPPFAQVIMPLQALSVPLARLAVLADAWLDAHLPDALGRLSFNIVITGKFDE